MNEQEKALQERVLQERVALALEAIVEELVQLNERLVVISDQLGCIVIEQEELSGG